LKWSGTIEVSRPFTLLLYERKFSLLDLDWRVISAKKSIRRENFLFYITMKIAKFSRREREIMEIIYAGEQATVAEIHAAMRDAPSLGAVRKMIQILESKGHLKHSKSGREHVYQPSQTKQSAAKRALQGLLDTFFGGSLREAVAAHLTGKAQTLDAVELKEIERLIQSARRNREPRTPKL